MCSCKTIQGVSAKSMLCCTAAVCALHGSSTPPALRSLLREQACQISLVSLTSVSAGWQDSKLIYCVTIQDGHMLWGRALPWRFELA